MARWSALVVVISALALAPVMEAMECVATTRPPLRTNGLLCGTALDLVADVLGDVDIALKDSADHVIATTHADANGDFTFQPVAEGIYALGLSEAGFHDTLKVIQVTGPQTRCARRMTIYFSVGFSCGSRATMEGVLALRLNVGGALVTIDDHEWQTWRIETGSDKFPLDEGVHRVTVEAEGYRPRTFTVRVRLHETTTRQVTLVRLSQ